MAGHFTTRLTPVECSMKAQAAIVAEADVVGVADESLVLIRKLKGNMFQTVLRARLERDPEGGTSIVLTTGMDRIVFVFSLVFLAAFLLLCVLWLLAYIRVFQSFQFSDEDRHNYLFVLMPFVCTILGVVLVQAGRHVSRDEAPFLTRLFVDATDAKKKGRTASGPSAVPTPRPSPPAPAPE